MWVSPFFGVLLWTCLPFVSWPAFIVASPILVAWTLSPFMAWWISLPQARKKASLSTQQKSYLRNLSRKTWAFFENFIGPEDNWLPPDNYQENPEPRIAHRTSPTNMGLSLLSSLAAHDFGYITTQQLLEQSQHTITSMLSLERYKGHLLNWYNTQTLQPLHPRYVSSVDSGNLADSLLTFKEGLAELHAIPILHSHLYDGLFDTINVLREKSKDQGAFKKVTDEAIDARLDEMQTIVSSEKFLKKLQSEAETFRDKLQTDPTGETYWWANALVIQCARAQEEIFTLAGWFPAVAQHQKLNEVFHLPDQIPSLNDIISITDALLPKVEQLIEESTVPDQKDVLVALQLRIWKTREMTDDMIDIIKVIINRINNLAEYQNDFI